MGSKFIYTILLLNKVYEKNLQVFSLTFMYVVEVKFLIIMSLSILLLHDHNFVSPKCVPLVLIDKNINHNVHWGSNACTHAQDQSSKPQSKSGDQYPSQAEHSPSHLLLSLGFTRSKPSHEAELWTQNTKTKLGWCHASTQHRT